ncbi:MAG: hypothetical protein JJU12_06180 [Chlamydiales bacterium]|nr:hypothetical protein [Chlamydiales bacterium]
MNALSEMVASERIPHALLFVGRKGAKLDEAARQFAVDLVGKYPHPDIREYFPEGKSGMHPIQTLRKLAEEVALVPYQAKWKIFILHDADRMLPTSGNALLKTFEEPAARTVIVLLTHHPERILPTILSRCQKMEFASAQEKVRHKVLEVLAGKEPIESLEEGERLDELFETILLWYRDRMLLNFQGGERYLTYPEYRTQIEKSPFIPLDHVEESLKQARLGCERSIKLSTCLEALLYKLL